MNMDRIKEHYNDYEEALNRLAEALAEDLSKGSIVIDGTIQRFEFSFELAWKLAGDVLKYQGIDVKALRMIIKEAFSTGLIEDGKAWIDMLEDRNKTAHIYDEKQALMIYRKIKDKYFELLNEFKKAVKKIGLNK